MCEATASWKWFNWLLAQLPPNKQPLLLNMDETACRLFYDPAKGVLASELVALAARRGRVTSSVTTAPCQVPAFNMRKNEDLGGTLIANDKSKGVTWLFDLESETALPVFLPYQAGNHETAVSADGKLVAVPQYEVVTSKGQGESSALAGWGVSVVNLSTGEAVALDGVANHSAQVGNGLVRHMPDGSTMSIVFDNALCDTPHLVRRIPVPIWRFEAVGARTLIVSDQIIMCFWSSSMWT